QIQSRVHPTRPGRPLWPAAATPSEVATVAGNNRRSSMGSRVRPGRPARVEVRVPGRRLRMEQLEDRTTPAIIQDGIGTWLAAGAAPAINGSPTGITDSPDTGAVEAVAPHPSDPNVLFAAGVN